MRLRLPQSENTKVDVLELHMDYPFGTPDCGGEHVPEPQHAHCFRIQEHCVNDAQARVLYHLCHTRGTAHFGS